MLCAGLELFLLYAPGGLHAYAHAATHVPHGNGTAGLLARIGLTTIRIHTPTLQRFDNKMQKDKIVGPNSELHPGA